MDGPLEPTSSTASNANDVPDDLTFVNFFSSALSIGRSSNPAMVGQPLQPSATVPVLTHPANAPRVVPSPQAAPPPIQSTPLMPLLESGPESDNNVNRTANLVKPSSFFNAPPVSSPLMMAPSVCTSMPTAPPLQPPLSLQRPYGTPVLQPFPPPTPPPSLTPISAPNTNYGPLITRDKVQEALSMLVQDNQFIDMVYRALLNAHNS